MITHSIARTVACPKGWHAEYHLSGEREPHRLSDASGKPIVYRSQHLAYTAALEALIAAMERVDAAYIDPRRQTACRPWQDFNPKSRAGRKALFNSIFRKGR
jgi:hypothetical protein